MFLLRLAGHISGGCALCPYLPQDTVLSCGFQTWPAMHRLQGTTSPRALHNLPFSIRLSNYRTYQLTLAVLTPYSAGQLCPAFFGAAGRCTPLVVPAYISDALEDLD